MPEFNLRQEAHSSPTECFLCQQYEGPFVDTGISKIEGQIILCVSKFDATGEQVRAGCVEQMGRAVGMHEDHEVAALLTDRETVEQGLRDTIADLEEQTPPDQVDLGPVFERLDGLESRLVDAFGKVEDSLKKPAPKSASQGKRSP